MATQLGDIDGDRRVEVDGGNAGCPNSVFISGRGFCYEFDREALIEAFRLELDDFYDPVASVSRHLLRLAA